MKTTSVTTHYERKLNTGDFSSVTLSAWATVEVEDGDDPAQADWLADTADDDAKAAPQEPPQ